MAFLESSVISDIRMQANIVDIIGSYIPITKKGNDYVAVCPFHDDHSPSMHISESKQIYKCFSCNAAGNVFTFVANYEDIGFIEAVNLVASKIGYKLSNQSKVFSSGKSFTKEKEIMDIALKFFINNLNTEFGTLAKDYLKKRGLNEEVLQEFQVGLSLDEKDSLYKLLIKKGYDSKTLLNMGLINQNAKDTYDFFTRRIVFPLWDKDGNVVGFSGRIYRNEEEAKYVNSRETSLYKKKETLYNYHNAKKYAKINSGIIVVEGFMDAIRLSASGIKNVVALQGTALTSEQIELLKKLRVPIYLCLDNDSAGIKANIVNGELLEKANLKVKIISFGEEKDPDEYILKKGVESFLDNYHNAWDLVTFKLQKLKVGKNLNNSDDLALYINEVLETLAKVGDEIKVNVTLNEISANYNIDKSILKNKLSEYQSLNKIQKEVFKPPVKVVGEKKTSSDIAAEHILYYMLNDKKYILEYQKNIGYFIKPIYRNLANYIVYYYNEKKEINVADFISFVFDKKEEYDKIIAITNEFKEELSEELFKEYVLVYQKSQKEEQIKELKNKLKNEVDMNKKITIAKQIAEIKKGVCTNGTN